MSERAEVMVKGHWRVLHLASGQERLVWINPYTRRK